VIKPLAFAIADSYGIAPKILANTFDFELITAENPSLGQVASLVPDLILFDWAPALKKRNTDLIIKIRSTAALKATPIILFHSDENDISAELWSTQNLIALEIPVRGNTLVRALNQCLPRHSFLLPVRDSDKATNEKSPEGTDLPGAATQKKVFIGHGGSAVWRTLREFLTDRLNLTVEEFNQESAAGLPTPERLRQMLSASSFAFMILTAENLDSEGYRHARENVIHETGLFQGRLGFSKAIILLEEDCKEFSNISGTGQIRFSSSRLAEKWEEIRHVLEREGIIRQHLPA